MKKSVLTKNQKKVFAKKVPGTDYGYNRDLEFEVSVSYDDECGNGHNTLSITGSIWKPMRDDIVAGGCIHDEIARYFPELKHLIKWHLVSSGGPLPYISNTIFHARDVSHKGKKPGEPVRFEKAWRFGDFPKLFTYQKNINNLLLSDNAARSIAEAEIIEVPHGGAPSGYKFKPNYTLSCVKPTHSDAWTDAPFKTRPEAEQFIKMCALGFSQVQTPVEFAAAVEPNIEAARRCAVWPEATLAQLQSEKALKERLPALMAEFAADIQGVGFIF